MVKFIKSIFEGFVEARRLSVNYEIAQRLYNTGDYKNMSVNEIFIQLNKNGKEYT
jgi:hypothetical protein